MGISGTQAGSLGPAAGAAPRERAVEDSAGHPVARVIAVALGMLLVGLVIGNFWRARKDNPAIASVNGATITSREFLHRCELVKGSDVLRQIIGEELELQLAQKQGVMPSAGDVQARYDELMKDPSSAQQVATSRETPDDVRRSVLLNLAQQNIIDKGITVSDADVRAFYDANCDERRPDARYRQPEMVQIEAIISDKETDIQAALHALASGAAFADVARKYSRDQSAQNGGVLPAIRRNVNLDSKLPGLQPAIFAMTVGQQIDDLRVGRAHWIIRCVGKKAALTRSFNEVEKECRLGAMLAKGIKENGQEIKSETAEMQRTANVAVFAAQYKDIGTNTR